MPRILCLDQSSFCGWAHGEPGDAPIFGTHRLPRSLTGSKRAKALYRFVRDMISANGIEKVYFEKPIIPKVTSFDTVYGLMGLATAIGFAADDTGLECIPIDQQTWRSEFGVPTQAPKKIKGSTERRAWLKQQTMDRCRRLGMDVTDDNSADACGIWFSMCQRILAKEAAPQFDFTQQLAM